MLHQPVFSRDVWITDRWYFDGMQALILENALLRVVVLPGKGGDIIEFRHKPTDTNFLLSQPGGLRNPQRTPPSAYSDTLFLDYFNGGWNDVLPNGGPPVLYRGALLGQHGEASLLPWDYAVLEAGRQRVSARLWAHLLRTPFYIEKEIALHADDPRLHLRLTIHNDGGTPLHCMWGQHIAFGGPFLDGGARIDVPPCSLRAHGPLPGFEPRRFQPGASGTWPHLPAPDGEQTDASRVPSADFRAQEMAYLLDLTDGWYAITARERGVGFGLRFDRAVFRSVWYWQQMGGAADSYPWWGRTHTAALEPWTSYPTDGLLESIANGSAVLLDPGESITTRMIATAYTGLGRVHRIAEDGMVEGE